VLLDSLLRL